MFFSSHGRVQYLGTWCGFSVRRHLSSLLGKGAAFGSRSHRAAPEVQLIAQYVTELDFLGVNSYGEDQRKSTGAGRVLCSFSGLGLSPKGDPP